VSFVEFGSNAMTGLQFNESEEVPSANRSLVSLQEMNPCIPRVAAAQLCSSSLNYILSDSFFNSSHSIWLGCFGPTILDIDTTETTFKTLKNVCNRTSLSNSWGYQNSNHPQCEACLRQRETNGSKKLV